MDPKEIVRHGYNKISYAYRDDDGGGWQSDYAGWLDKLSPNLPCDASILDLGCGCGIPTGQLLAGEFKYTGVDISEVQIERARDLVPRGDFILADFSDINFPRDRFTAIVSFFAIIHLPVAEQPNLFERIYDWLQPGGYLMATVGHTAWTGTEADWHGTEMYWSHAGEESYLSWLYDLDFDLKWTRFIPEGDGGHTLILAQKVPSD